MCRWPLPTREILGSQPTRFVSFPQSLSSLVVKSKIERKLLDGVVLIRTVGGHVRPILNDIIALDGFIGIKDILVIHHTGISTSALSSCTFTDCSLADCGTLAFKDENIRKGLKARLPERDDIDGMSFGAIKEYDCSLALLSVVLHSTCLWEIVNMLKPRVIASSKAYATISPF
jgi:hypothetical protein